MFSHKHTLKFLHLCFAEEKKSYRFAIFLVNYKTRTKKTLHPKISIILKTCFFAHFIVQKVKITSDI